MHRFFIPADGLKDDTVILTGSVVHQIKNVLRFRPGDVIVVLDDSGWEYKVRLISVQPERITGCVEHKVLARTEPRAKITLYQSMLKARRFEWVLQKGTELGIVEFVPLVTDRCVIASLDGPEQPRFGRWQRIILEAAEQSERGRLPRLHTTLLFPQACERAHRADLAVLPWEGEKIRSLRSVLADYPGRPTSRVHDRSAPTRRPFSISVFIGPEGGFTPPEVDQALRHGITPVSLGPRILRAETAALVATAIVLYQLEDI